MNLRTWRMLKTLAERKRDEERKRLGMVDRRIEAASQMLQRIEGYQADVNAAQYGRVQAVALAPQVVTGTVDVYLRLEDAKQRQQRDLDGLKQLRCETLEGLRLADAEVGKFDKLIERAVLEAQAAQARLDQKTTDEITNAAMARALLNSKRTEARA